MKKTLCIVGLGYVGLPLAYAFARKGHPVCGYDITGERIEALQKGHDWTKELTNEQLRSVSIDYSSDPAILEKAAIVLMAIPTPVDENNHPDLSLVENATHTVGKHLKRGAIVVYESTVYPGVTDDICGPILEKESGMQCGIDFKLGYSPERINPGDKKHTIDKIVKIVAGQDPETTEELAALYGSIVEAGIHRAPSIRVAEMAKAIENAQRDLNIAFINEIAMLCNTLGLRTKDVLDAAGTKWNFLRFQPGLVGGHCIGVDPYYLVEVAKQLGMDTRLIAAGRSINDGMSAQVTKQVAAALGSKVKGARVLVLGLTFKENIPDTRNSKSFDVLKALEIAGCTVTADDSEMHPKDFERMKLKNGSLEDGPYDAILLLVAHRQYAETPAATYIAALKPGGVFYDLKSLFEQAVFEQAEMTYLSL